MGRREDVMSELWMRERRAAYWEKFRAVPTPQQLTLFISRCKGGETW